MIACECGTTYEAAQPSRHLAPCGLVCLVAAGMGADGQMAPTSPPLPSEMHCPAMMIGGEHAYEMPGRCPRGCYGARVGGGLPPPAPAAYVLEPHGHCEGAGQHASLTKWRANLGGYFYGRTAWGFCRICGVWIGLRKVPESP